MQDLNIVIGLQRTWDSLTIAVSICPCQLHALSKHIAFHVQQLYISVNLKLQNNEIFGQNQMANEIHNLEKVLVF